MRKSDLVAAIVTITGLTRRQADDVLSSTVEHITDALARGESLNLMGFGAFTVAQRSARTGRHPQTGEPMEISASKHVNFKPGKALKEKLGNL